MLLRQGTFDAAYESFGYPLNSYYDFLVPNDTTMLRVSKNMEEKEEANLVTSLSDSEQRCDARLTLKTSRSLW